MLCIVGVFAVHRPYRANSDPRPSSAPGNSGKPNYMPRRRIRNNATSIPARANATAVAIPGFRLNAWFVVGALVAHGVFDFVHHRLILNPGVPSWWPSFCLAHDVNLLPCWLQSLFGGLGGVSRGEFGGEFLPAECGIDVGKLRHRRPVSLYSPAEYSSWLVY